jgi:hypothetical protein
LHDAPNEISIRLTAARKYLELGLILPARELLDHDPPDRDAADALTAVRKSLGSVRNDNVPWQTLAHQFDSNLSALVTRGVAIEPIRRAWERERTSIQLFRDNQGREQLRRRNVDGRWCWFPKFGDHRAESAAMRLPRNIDSETPGPYLFNGLDWGGYFERVFDATRHTMLTYSCALYIVEPFPELLAFVLHVRDWAGHIGDERTNWLIGADWAGQLQRLWDDQPDLPLPSSTFAPRDFRPPAVPSPPEFVRSAAARRLAAIHHARREIEGQYSSRDRSYWAARMADALSGDGPPLRVLAGVTRHSTFLKYSMRDIARAMHELGHTFALVTESADHELVSPLSYCRAIKKLDPDLFFCLDHLRPELAEFLPSNLPLLTWDQDNLPSVFTPEKLARIGPSDFIAGYAKPRCVAAGCNPRQFLYANVPTCPQQFGGPALTEAERRRFTCDLSYVSHASQTPELFHVEQRALVDDDRIRGLLDDLYEAARPVLRKFGALDYVRSAVLLREALAERRSLTLNRAQRDWLIEWYLWRLSDRAFRHEALAWVGQWAAESGRAFRIYGNGWDRHETLARFAAGAVENGRDLLCVYRASRINLQLMPAGFVHQRALDGLAAGGFFLARRSPPDVDGDVVRRIAVRIRELDVRSTAQLLDSDDAALRALLHEFRGPWIDRLDSATCGLHERIQAAAELVPPTDVFPRFREILFDTADEFAERAERFLDDESARTPIATEMREAVIRHYSYRTYVDRFLRAMAGFLARPTEQV